MNKQIDQLQQSLTVTVTDWLAIKTPGAIEATKISIEQLLDTLDRMIKIDLSLYSVSFKGAAETTTTPDPVDGVAEFWIATTGVYPDFGNVEITSDLGILSWDGVNWTAVNIDLDLSIYAKKSETAELIDFLKVKENVNTIINGAWSTDGSDLTAMPDNSANNQKYINMVNADEVRVVGGVRVDARSTGTVKIIKGNADFSVITEIESFIIPNVGLYSCFLSNVHVLNIGERIGVELLGASVGYTPVGGGFWESSIPSIQPSGKLGYQTGGPDLMTLKDIDDRFKSIAPTPLESVVISTATTHTLETMGETGGADTSYFNNFDLVASPHLVTSLRIRSTGSGTLIIKKCNADFSNRTVIKTIAIVAGINVLPLNYFLKSGERLGIMSDVAIYFSSAAGSVGFWAGGEPAGGVGAGFYEGIEMGYTYSYKSLNQPYNLDELKIIVDEFSNSETRHSSKPTRELYFSNFTVDEWVRVGWNYAAGKYTSAAIGVANFLELPNIYHSDKRRARAIFRMSANTDLRIRMKQQDGLDAGEGASMFGINASTSKLTMYEAIPYLGDNELSSIGVSTTPFIEVAIPFAVVGGRIYAIDIEKDSNKSILTLSDTITGQSVSCDVTGWDVGRQNEKYAFYVESGDPVELLEFSVRSTIDVDIVVSGDSITEGVMVLDKSQRHAELIRSTYNPNTVISARGGTTIDQIISKFDTEYKFMLPKYLLVQIGANGGNTEAKFLQLISLCELYGIKLILNHNVVISSMAHIERNELIDSFGLPGAKFDLATATSNNPSVGYNAALYYDAGVHPNVIGNQEMFKRIAIDLPFLI